MRPLEELSRVARLPLPPLGIREIATLIEEIERMDEATFRRFQFDLVSRYRTEHDEQEGLELAMREALRGQTSMLAAERIEEILAMLTHVHDPLI